MTMNARLEPITVIIIASTLLVLSSAAVQMAIIKWVLIVLVSKPHFHIEVRIVHISVLIEITREFSRGCRENCRPEGYVKAN